MTTPNTILVDLLSGQSTADSIAGRLRIPCLVIESMLKRHQTDGLVATKPIAGGTLTVWHLTHQGKQTATPLKRPTIKPRPILITAH
jgi:predicted ArsR family transcriptional regulator